MEPFTVTVFTPPYPGDTTMPDPTTPNLPIPIPADVLAQLEALAPQILEALLRALVAAIVKHVAP